MERTSASPPPVALTIAGSDSGGGAGIQADLKTFHQWKVYGASALTAVTAQNTLGVQAVHALPPSIVAAQIDSVFSDLAPRAVKCGMLANAAIVRQVAGALARLRPDAFVLDPVMVATSGDVLLEPDAVAALRRDLVPLATVVTPNWPEAVLLTGVRDATIEGMEAAARALVEAGAGAALVKGGHLEGDEVADLLWDGRRRRVFRGRARRDPPHAWNGLHAQRRDHRRAGARGLAGGCGRSGGGVGAAGDRPGARIGRRPRPAGPLRAGGRSGIAAVPLKAAVQAQDLAVPLEHGAAAELADPGRPMLAARLHAAASSLPPPRRGFNRLAGAAPPPDAIRLPDFARLPGLALLAPPARLPGSVPPSARHSRADRVSRALSTWVSVASMTSISTSSALNDRPVSGTCPSSSRMKPFTERCSPA